MRRVALTLAAAALLWSPLAPGHGGNANRAAWDICSEARVEDACEFKDHHGDLHRGTCQSFDKNLMCVRKKPIIPASVKDEGVRKSLHLHAPQAHSQKMLKAALLIAPFGALYTLN